MLFTWRIPVLVPDPASVHESPRRPPLFVGELLTGGGDAPANLVLESVELVIRVHADQLRVQTPAVRYRALVVQVRLTRPVRVHDEQVLSSTVRQPVVCKHRPSLQDSDF